MAENMRSGDGGGGGGGICPDPSSNDGNGGNGSPVHASSSSGGGVGSLVAYQHRHSFSKKTFHKPTNCHYCSDLLWGLMGQGYICDGKDL